MLSSNYLELRKSVNCNYVPSKDIRNAATARELSSSLDTSCSLRGALCYIGYLTYAEEGKECHGTHGLELANLILGT